MSTYTLRCVILEDEDDIRDWLVKKLNQYSEIEIVGEASTIDEAFNLIATTQPDVAFMDVQLIGGDAFTLLNRLQNNGLPIPFIVMATGYPEYVMTALNDYRQYIVQYLLKPFVENWESKFRKAIDALISARLRNAKKNVNFSPSKINEKEKNLPGHIFLQNKGSLLRLVFKDIAYLEAAGGGESIIVIDDKENPQVDVTLNKLLKLLPDQFIRISKSNLVNIDRVLTVNRGDRTVEVNSFPKNKILGISDVYYNDFLNVLPLAKK